MDPINQFEHRCGRATKTIAVLAVSIVLTACATAELAQIRETQDKRWETAKNDAEQAEDQRVAIERDLERENQRILDQQQTLSELERTATLAEQNAVKAQARAGAAVRKSDKLSAELDALKQSMLAIQAKQKINSSSASTATGESDKALRLELDRLRKRETLLKKQMQRTMASG